MTRSRPQLIIRPPALSRVFGACFTVFWVGVVIWTTMIRHHGVSVAVGIAFIAVGVTLNSRLLRIGAIELDNGDLRIRNNFGTRTYRRTDVERFLIGHNGGTRQGGTIISALLTDDTLYGIDATSSRPFGGQRTTKRQIAALQAWLHPD